MDNLESGFRYRDPAPQTLKFMEEQLKFNQTMTISMNDVRNDIKNVCKSIQDSNEINKVEHKAIMTRLGRIEKFALGTLVIFALASLYFLFRNAGLPTP
jgi:hypothetical protein